MLCRGTAFLNVCVVFGSSLLAGACAPVGALLRVREDSPRAAFWFRLYDDLPRAWKTSRPVLLREVSLAELKRVVARAEGKPVRADDGDDVVDGYYQDDDQDENGTPIISLSETLRGDEAALVFTHEYAHYLWDDVLTDAQRARYTRLWKAQKRARRLITDYAQTSPEEGFAESASYFVRRPAQLQRKDAASMQFLRDLTEPRDGDTVASR